MRLLSYSTGWKNQIMGCDGFVLKHVSHSIAHGHIPVLLRTGTALLEMLIV
jgi:hypothetical protein